MIIPLPSLLRRAINFHRANAQYRDFKWVEVYITIFAIQFIICCLTHISVFDVMCLAFTLCIALMFINLWLTEKQHKQSLEFVTNLLKESNDECLHLRTLLQSANRGRKRLQRKLKHQAQIYRPRPHC